MNLQHQISYCLSFVGVVSEVANAHALDDDLFLAKCSLRAISCDCVMSNAISYKLDGRSVWRGRRVYTSLGRPTLRDTHTRKNIHCRFLTDAWCSSFLRGL